MTADALGATQDYSNRSAAATGARRPSAGASRGPFVLRATLGVVGLVGAVLLVVSTFSTVVQIKVLTTTEVAGKDLTVSGADLHSVALIVVAVFALLMLVGAVRGARPAMAGLTIAGVLGLGIIIGLDVPELGSTGEISKFYEDVSAGAASGFYLETLGAVLLLAAGGLMLILGADGVATRLSAISARAEAAAGAGLERARARRRASGSAGPDAAEPSRAAD